MTILISTSINKVGEPFTTAISWESFQASIKGSGDLAAVITIKISNDKKEWMKAATITLSNTTLADGFSDNEIKSWTYVLVDVTGISGTNAVVTVTAGK